MPGISTFAAGDSSETSECQLGVFVERITNKGLPTANVLAVEAILADFVDATLVINSTFGWGFLTRNPLVLGTLDIDVGAEVLVQGQKPVPDLVGVYAILV